MSAISNNQAHEGRIRELEAELSRCRAKLNGAIKEQKRVEEALRRNNEKYGSILEEIEEGYFEVNLSGYITFFNSAMCDVAGRRADQLKGMHYREHATPETVGRMFRVFSSVFQTGRSEKISDCEFIRKDGARRTLEIAASLRRNPNGRPIGFKGIARDVTEQKKAAAALRRIQREYRLIAENTTDVIETLSLESRITFASPSVKKLRGWTVEETLEQTLGDILSPESLKAATRAIAEELTLEARGTADPRRSRTLELRMRHKDGNILSTETTFRFLRDAVGKPMEILWTIRDISERKASQEELARLAYHDPLTGLFNRRSFLERLDESLAYAIRYDMERAVFYIDLNRFKEVNDAWGHEAGDALLQEVGKRLCRSLRNTDIVCRLGGDEFAVILNNPVDLYPELAAANLLNTLSLPYELRDVSIDFITPSIGVSLFPWDGRDGEILIRKADAAMRRGKRRQSDRNAGGGGSIHFYEETLPRVDASSGRGRR